MNAGNDEPNVSPADTANIWLTVITPVLNAEPYIAGCIQNVIDQKASGIEHIIMDGMSTDQTLAIARRFAGITPSIKIISEKDGSQAAAMNHGIRLAQGKVIGFLNADDYYAPDTLKRVAAIFKGLPEPSLIVGNCNVLDQSDRIIVVNRPSRLTLLDLIKGREYPWNPAAYFYHKSIHDVIGGYDEKEHYVMDLDFLLRAAPAAHVFYFDEVWGNFRWIEGTKTFNDNKAGLMQKRCDNVRDKYAAHLSPSERLGLWFFRFTRRHLRPSFLWIKQQISRIKGHP
jgi:glycosyltransferase involved in cell wall biosynthesis